jgi:hypothetical protein
VHVPQAAVRETPQLSLDVTFPQFLPSRAQNAAVVSAVQPHTPDTPPPPHATPVPAHVPHDATVRDVPQLSAATTLPQFLPRRAQNAASASAVQPQTLFTAPPPHVTPVPLHVPHEGTVREAPQLSFAVTGPQFAPTRTQNAASSSAVQPHTPDSPPPPQATPVPAHVPHETTVRDAPQLSLSVTLPQFLPRRPQNAALLSVVQPHTFVTPPPPHTTPVPAHVPQLAVRAAPQLSLAVTPLQFLPRREQKAASVSAVQPHTLDAPLPPQLRGDVHVPHELTDRAVPQLSLSRTLPQFLPRREQKPELLSGVHPQTLADSAPQVLGAAHVPHEATVRDTPQLSLNVKLPQSLPSRVQKAASVSAVHPQTPLPPQTCGAVHVPHEFTDRAVPQLSLSRTLPQFLLRRAHISALVSAVQPHTLFTPPPPHETPVPAHVPHETTVRDRPQLSLTVKLPQSLLRRAHNAASSSGVHPHTFVTPPPPHETPVPAHVPHETTLRVAPQLSAPVTAPQFLPTREQKAALASGVQPQTFVTPPPPHETPVPLHAPHEATVRDVTQLSFSVTFPQFLPSRVQNATFVSAVQPQTPAAPPPLHVSGAVQLPHDAMTRHLPHRSQAVSGPHSLPCRAQTSSSDSGAAASSHPPSGMPPSSLSHTVGTTPPSSETSVCTSAPSSSASASSPGIQPDPPASPVLPSPDTPPLPAPPATPVPPPVSASPPKPAL